MTSINNEYIFNLSNSLSVDNIKTGIGEEVAERYFYCCKQWKLLLAGLVHIALKKQCHQLSESLKVIENNYFCDMDEKTLKPGPQRMFGWFSKDFETRRKKAHGWINDFINHYHKCLERKKFFFDIKEVHDILKNIFSTWSFDKNSSSFSITISQLSDAVECLALKELVNNNITKNTRHVLQVTKNSTSLVLLHPENRTTTTAFTSKTLEEYLVDNRILDPVAMRYEINYSIAQSNKILNIGFQKLSDIRTRIDLYKKLEVNEVVAHRCALDAYYAVSAIYKTSFSNLSEKYEKDLEDFNIQLYTQKQNLEKLRSNMAFLQDEMKRFQEQIEIFKNKYFLA